MVPNNDFGRVDTLELKDHIYRKIGHQRADEYFDQLNRYLSFKLNKDEFDKSCITTIGKENIWLHNQLIRSIIQNSSQAKIPPHKPSKANGLGVRVPNNCQKKGFQSAFPRSPHKCMSPINRKFRERPSPLGPLGKSCSITYDETIMRINPQQSPAELHSLCSRPPAVEDGEEVEQFSRSPRPALWKRVTAPFGISVDVGSTHKGRHCGFEQGSLGQSCQSSSELPDSGSLRSRLQKKLASEGVGVSLDCCNLLNKSLDVFLKRLIEPCMGFAGSRSMDLRGSHRTVPGGSSRWPPQQQFVNMQDFHVAMEANPRVLGENWPVQMEKINHYVLQE